MQQYAVRLKYTVLGRRCPLFCHVCGSQDSRRSSRARNEVELLLNFKHDSPKGNPHHTLSHCTVWPPPTTTIASSTTFPLPEPAPPAPTSLSARGELWECWWEEGRPAAVGTASLAGQLQRQLQPMNYSEYELRPRNASEVIFPASVSVATTFSPSFL